jgi:serine protease
MPYRAPLVLLVGLACCATSIAGQSLAVGPEINPVRMHPVAIGPEANRLIVGFRAVPGNAVIKTVIFRTRGRRYSITQAQTSAADVTALAQRVGLNLARSRQFTPSMHVLSLPKTLYGTDVVTVLGKLRADPAVQFADVDALRYPLLVPTNPLFGPMPGVASGQWYLNTPGPQTVEGFQTTDLAATDAVSAWNITTGSPGIVIADVDTGVLFEHPDLLRAGLGGRLLPGYDFVGPDYNPKSPYNALGTYDIANDGDGWDPDPSDPGDWISQADVANPNQLFVNDTVAPSSWHGTRVVGVFGAITDNNVGTAGMTWGSPSQPGPWVLPVRALGKGGGYDSDIIAGIEWAAGLAVTNPDGHAVPDNPYPADIINLSLGGESTCPSDYQDALSAVTAMGVLVVASAGNSVTPVTGTSSVEAPANCSASVPGMIAVAGLRNVGTKVGYSSSGPEIGLGAPAGNCINLPPGPCLRSIDTTTDLGTTVPLGGSDYSYTNETNENVGTSFSAPIVSGIAALMRSVNNNLSPEQLVSRIQASATRYPPNTGGLPVCPTLDPVTDQCSCLTSGQCGAGMVNAYRAVQAAQQPIGVIVIPATVMAGSVFDATGSVAACNTSAAPPVPLSIVSYKWTENPPGIIVSGATSPQVTVSPVAGGILTLTVTDSAKNVDIETVTFNSASSATSTAPISAGTSATACPAELNVTPSAPTVTESFSPASVGENSVSMLAITLSNPNGFTLIQSSFSATLPGNLLIATTPAVATTCTGTGIWLTNTTTSLKLSGATVPAKGSCTIIVPVNSASAGSYASVILAKALSTVPAGGNSASASATLTVTAPSSGGGGGGALEWLDLVFVGGVLLAGRRRAADPLEWAA